MEIAAAAFAAASTAIAAGCVVAMAVAMTAVAVAVVTAAAAAPCLSVLLAAVVVLARPAYQEHVDGNPARFVEMLPAGWHHTRPQRCAWSHFR